MQFQNQFDHIVWSAENPAHLGSHSDGRNRNMVTMSNTLHTERIFLLLSLYMTIDLNQSHSKDRSEMNVTLTPLLIMV